MLALTQTYLAFNKYPEIYFCLLKMWESYIYSETCKTLKLNVLCIKKNNSDKKNMLLINYQRQVWI